MNVVFVNPDHPEQPLTLTEQPDPRPGPTQIVVDVKAAGVNRADLLQRRGLYPPPPDESDILGLEIAGDVLAVGEKVHDFRIGERVFGLVAGGGYAEQCLLDHRLAHRIPDDRSYVWAAALCEIGYTANENLFHHGRLQTGESVLIHAGASGVGSAAVRMAALRDCRVLTTTSTETKQAFCRTLGAETVIPYKTRSFVEVVRAAGGVDVILDFVGAAYLSDNLKSLKQGGRLVVVGLLGGRKGELDLSLVLRKNLSITGSVLRARTLAEKIAVKGRFCAGWQEAIDNDDFRPHVFQTFPLSQAEAAHACMRDNQHHGKIVLTRDESPPSPQAPDRN
ncbi:NAD(P)H-quinone oxidoreductase [Acanthopleuribacter pedis]|uniref:NAD(P)H-quinone oxidoreductase n=1 Tax=Acanthopleuribacter pedis TaxID=442870 RepID=A0A8J7QJY3_9BACT|nr:NAD(P)H-quinone oxidoreductase [Acanthopleuribacter pedis]MBO1319585.1 NAD(P)H-quinone oxidoreductase [Acanthopleuribacter pedis]